MQYVDLNRFTDDELQSSLTLKKMLDKFGIKSVHFLDQVFAEEMELLARAIRSGYDGMSSYVSTNGMATKVESLSEVMSQITFP